MNNGNATSAPIARQQNPQQSSPPEVIIFEGRVLYRGGHVAHTELTDKFSNRKFSGGERTRKRKNRKAREALAAANELGRAAETESLIREIDSLDVNTPLPIELSPLAERQLASTKERAA